MNSEALASLNTAAIIQRTIRRIIQLRPDLLHPDRSEWLEEAVANSFEQAAIGDSTQAAVDRAVAQTLASEFVPPFEMS